MPDATFHVTHLAPLRFRPVRARADRFALAPVTTTVRVREVGRAEMPWAGHDGRYRPVCFHDGALWTPMDSYRNRADGLPDLAALAAGALSPSLMGAREGTCEPRDLVLRSPVVPDTRALLASGRLHEAPAPGAVGTVVRDGRDRAARDMALFAEDRLRVCDADLYVRLRGPLAVVAHHARAHEPEMTLTTRHGLDIPPPDFAVPRRAAAVWALRARLAGEGAVAPPRVGGMHGVPAVDGDDDLLNFLNGAPLQMVPLADEALAALRNRRLPRDPELEARAAAALDLRDLALTGGVGLEDGWEAADTVEALALGIAEALARARLEVPSRLAGSVAYCREILRPALEREPAPEDLAALDGAAPAGP